MMKLYQLHVVICCRNKHQTQYNAYFISEFKMSPSSQGIYIIDSEISIVLMAMRRGNLWNSNSHQDTNTENLIKELITLKKSLTTATDFKTLNTVEFLMPFLDVIR